MMTDEQKRSFIEELSCHLAFVLLVKGNEADVGGNAVIVAPYIALTATHVIKNNSLGSFSDFDSTETLEKERHYPSESLNILMYSSKYGQHYLLNVPHMIHIPKSDLAILLLKDPSGQIPEDIWNPIELCLTPPEVDEHVVTIGTVFKDDSFHVLGESLHLYGGPHCQDRKIDEIKSYFPPFQMLFVLPLPC